MLLSCAQILSAMKSEDRYIQTTINYTEVKYGETFYDLNTAINIKCSEDKQILNRDPSVAKQTHQISKSSWLVLLCVFTNNEFGF